VRGRWICGAEGSLEEHLKLARHELFQSFMRLRRMYPLRGGPTEVVELERAWRHLENLLYYEWSLPRRAFVAASVGFGFDAPVALPVGESALYLRGRLDRVDRLSEGIGLRTMRLGRGRALEEEGLQPELDLGLGVQVLVCEEALYRGELVQEAALIHLTPEGATERAFRGSDLEALRSQTRAWLEQASALLAAGDFVRSPLETDCQRCAFLRLCGPQASQESARALRASGLARHQAFLAMKEALYVG
jgi:hypothetical protein